MIETDNFILYHYTSLEGFYRIITSGAIALCDVIKSNDPAEGEYALEMMKKAYKKMRGDEEINDADYKKLHIAFFEFLEEEKISGRLQQAILSLSLCQPEVPLALWRTYGDNGRGVAIGIAKEKLREIGEKPGFEFRQVEYLDEEEMLKKYMKFWKEQLQDRNDITQDENDKLKEAIRKQYMEGYFIKRQENAFEKEWRLVYRELNLQEYSTIKVLTDKLKISEELDAYMKQDDMVIFYKLAIKDEQIINTIMLGPQCKITYNEIQWFLQKYGIKVCGLGKDISIMRG